VVVDGFLVADTQGIPSSESFPREVIEPLMEDILAAPRYRQYVARLDGVVAGGAAMRIDDGLAQLCGASTLPAFRRRGVQTRLLLERLRLAAAVGCDLALVTTQPGSRSQANAIKGGFERLYTRAVMVK
jgi:ribosomal protein S18 acetylase RimI-like enzyme